MSNKQLRVALRYWHIFAASAMGPAIYSSTLRDVDVYMYALQFVIFPMTALSGTLMWQQARISKWRKRRAESRELQPS